MRRTPNPLPNSDELIRQELNVPDADRAAREGAPLVTIDRERIRARSGELEVQQRAASSRKVDARELRIAAALAAHSLRAGDASTAGIPCSAVGARTSSSVASGSQRCGKMRRPRRSGSSAG